MNAEAYAKLMEHVIMMAELHDESVHLTMRGVALIALVACLGIMVTPVAYLLHGPVWALVIMAVYIIGLGVELFCFIRVKRLLKGRSTRLVLMMTNDIRDLVYGRL